MFDRRAVGVSLLCLFVLLVGAHPVQGDLITTLTVSETTEPDGSFLYEYLLSNDPDSELSAVSLLLDVSKFADLHAITGPVGWDVTYNPGDPAISWEATAVALGVQPGSSGSFSIISRIGPALSDYFIVGLEETGPRIDSNFGQIAGPNASAVPEPSTLVLCGIALLGLLGCTSWPGNSLRRHAGRSALLTSVRAVEKTGTAVEKTGKNRDMAHC